MPHLKLKPQKRIMEIKLSAVSCNWKYYHMEILLSQCSEISTRTSVLLNGNRKKLFHLSTYNKSSASVFVRTGSVSEVFRYFHMHKAYNIRFS